MKTVSFDEYMKNVKTYKPGEIIPMTTEDIWRVARANESGKVHNKLNKIASIATKIRNIGDNRYKEYQKNITTIESKYKEATKYERYRRIILAVTLLYIAYQVS